MELQIVSVRRQYCDDKYVGEVHFSDENENVLRVNFDEIIGNQIISRIKDLLLEAAGGVKISYHVREPALLGHLEDK